MNIEKQKSRRATRLLIFEVLLLIAIYLVLGTQPECGWLCAIPLSVVLWIGINIPIAICDPMNDPYDPE